MKTGIKVTKENIATICGYVQKVLKRKTFITKRNVCANRIKKANEFLNSALARSYRYVEKDGRIIMGNKEGRKFSLDTIKVDEMLGKKFIAIRGLEGSGYIIGIGDKVHISTQKILIHKDPVIWNHNTTPTANMSCIEALEFNA